MKKILLISVAIFIILGTYSLYIIYKLKVPPNESYGHIILRDASGYILTKKGLSGGYMIPYTGSLSGELFEAIIYIEDKRFMRHSGIDYKAKLSGIEENIRARNIVRGSSTITEQYIKNRYYRGAKRSIKQKLDESISAWWIEQTRTKEEILREYVDNIYFGNNIYGLQTALEFYFGSKNIENLTKDDILDIITRIRTPNISNTNIGTWGEYRTEVANKLGWSTINSGLNNTYKRNSIELYPQITQRIIDLRTVYCKGKSGEIYKWVYTLPENICRGQSIDLNLTIISTLQDYSSDTIRKVLGRIEKENVTGGAIYIYNPSDKKVLAYIGNRGVSPTDGDIDMITRRRSVGSILKPFIYLLALKKGAELDSLILDDTKTYPTGVDKKVFIPQNYNPRIYGPIRLKEALGNSLNSSTVRLSEVIGITQIYDFFQKIGLKMNHDIGYYGYGISLGTVELSLENIVESYSILTDMEDKDNFLIQKALSDPKNRAKTFGISSILNSSIDLPVKTGTSTDFRDNWAISYHRDAIIGVWVGNANGSPMEDISGVSGAGPIWHSIAEYMIQEGLMRRMSLDTPLGISESFICLDSPCLRKEKTYIKNKKIKSNILDNLYYEEDFIGTMSLEENEKWNIQ